MAAGVGEFLQILGTTVQAGAQIDSALTTKEQARTQEQLLFLEAEKTRLATDRQARQLSIGFQKLRGSQLLAGALSGVTSQGFVEQESEGTFIEDLSALISAGQQRQENLLIQAREARKSGDAALTGGIISSLGTLASGFGKTIAAAEATTPVTSG